MHPSVRHSAGDMSSKGCAVSRGNGAPAAQSSTLTRCCHPAPVTRGVLELGNDHAGTATKPFKRIVDQKARPNSLGHLPAKPIGELSR